MNTKKQQAYEQKRLSQTAEEKAVENAKRRTTRKPMSAEQKQQKAEYDKARKTIKNEVVEEEKRKEKMTVLRPKIQAVGDGKEGLRRKLSKKECLSNIHHRICPVDHPGRGCAAQCSTHRITQWSPGTFHIPCQHCGARMNPPEKKRGWKGCYHDGKVDAEHMKRTFYFLQNPPQLMKQLTDPEHVNARAYLANDRKVNAHFAMGSIITNRD
ncbi:hypothetical protein QR680_012830 [Steinernema hermaphroditum]|uniref:Uncharacterized protein n=1 Tax=Steinernema hermaphroditum TaxID=289476 RepID=A0AA39M1G0_9BILA|nr:hypothetical protein QR680_012830 [Steinernema hermaphroditum]